MMSPIRLVMNDGISAVNGQIISLKKRTQIEFLRRIRVAWCRVCAGDGQTALRRADFWHANWSERGKT